MQSLFEGDKESNEEGKVSLLQPLCKDEIHFICHTSQKRRGAPSFSIPFTPKISSLNPYTPRTKLKYQYCLPIWLEWNMITIILLQNFSYEKINGHFISLAINYIHFYLLHGFLFIA